MSERVEDEGFQNTVLDIMRQSTTPCLTSARVIYHNTKATSAARKVVFENTVRDITPAVWETWKLGPTTDGALMLNFLVELLTKLPLASRESEETASIPSHQIVVKIPRYAAILENVQNALQRDAQVTTEALFSQVKSMDALNNFEFMMELFGALIEWRSGKKARLREMKWCGIGEL